MFFMNITTPVFSPKTMHFTHVLGFIDKELQEFRFRFCFFATCTTFFITCSRFAYLLVLCVFTTVDCTGHHFGVGPQY